MSVHGVRLCVHVTCTSNTPPQVTYPSSNLHDPTILYDKFKVPRIILILQYLPILYSPDSLDPQPQLEAGDCCSSACISVLLAVMLNMSCLIAIPTYQPISSPSSSGNECLWRLPLIATHTQSHFFILKNIHHLCHLWFQTSGSQGRGN